MWRRTACALGAALWSLTACGELGPEFGEPTDAGTTACTLVDSDPSSPVSWAEVKGEIFAKRCGCHMTPAGFGATVGGLLLADHASALLGGRHQKAGGPDAPIAIAPGAPCDSYLLAKTGETPPFGARMPLTASPLSGAERQLVVDWIAEGARK
jgi:hypothetical protein